MFKYILYRPSPPILRPSPAARTRRAHVLLAFALLAGVMACGPDPDPTECRSGFEPPAAARSCELVLMEAGSGVVSVEFADDTVGEWVSQPPSSAIAFHAAGDQAMSGAVVTAGEGGGFTVENASCFDDAGAEIDGVAERFAAPAGDCQ